MKRAMLALALILAGATAEAANSQRDVRRQSCDVESSYSVDTNRRAFVFSQSGHEPGEIGIGGGRLFIDGKEQTLSAADHERLRRMEQEMHLLVPQLRQVTVEAVDIAFVALIEVARGLSSTPKESVASLEAAHRNLRSEMSAKPFAVLDGEALGDVVKPIITRHIPEIVGGAVSGALKAAFGGEAKALEFERRMQRMERELDSKVEARAKSLEPLADAMCDRLQVIDQIDDALEFRLPDGERMELLKVDRRERREPKH